MLTDTPSLPTLLGLPLDVAKTAALAEVSFRTGMTEGVGPAKGSWGANVIDAGVNAYPNPSIHWFTSPEELVAFIAGGLYAGLGEEVEGTPTERATMLCAAIREATHASTILDVCDGWFGEYKLTWVGSFDDLYTGDSEVPEEAHRRFEEFLENAGRRPPGKESAKRQCFLDWLQSLSDDGEETGFS